MEPTQTLSLLGGLSPAQFMRRHWQKKPLLVRQAIAGMRPLLSASEMERRKGAGRRAVTSRRPSSAGVPEAMSMLPAVRSMT